MIADNDLRQAVAHFTAKFDGRTVPRPSHWSGFDVLVSSWEFWEQGDARLHRRWRYDQCRDGWRLVTLYP
jgi:pyridoxamine 5'-phosphate oxidase